uniref:Uncharacterized protein n=1 Tax=Arundo donax TaxID=35708 RepID=A0A0A9DRX6_ARUDO
MSEKYSIHHVPVHTKQQQSKEQIRLTSEEYSVARKKTVTKSQIQRSQVTY